MRQTPAVGFLQLLICAQLGTTGFDPVLIISMAVKLICALFKNRQLQQTEEGRVCKLCLAGHFCLCLALSSISYQELSGYAWIPVGGQRLSMEEVQTRANQQFYKEIGVKLWLKYLCNPWSRGYENATHCMLTFNFVKLK